MSPKVIATTQRLTYELPNKVLFKDVNLSVQEGDCIGLVGKNGTGKSTLLKLLARKIQPTAGTVDSSCSAYYLPQLDFSLFQNEQSIEEYIAHHNGKWPLVNAALHKWFNTSTIQPTKKLKTLSGGELVKLHLAIAQSKNPNLLLLDEPTNHLDAEGLNVLQNFLKSFPGTFIITSHDPFFLDLVVNHIWELDEKTIKQYGGNYSHYEEQKEIGREAQARNYESAKKDLGKAQRSLQFEQTRAARSKRKGRKQADDHSMSAKDKGFFKNRASANAGKQRVKLEKIIQERKEIVSSLKEDKKRKSHFVLEHDSHEGRKSLIRVERGALKVGNRVLVSDISLHIKYGDRFVLVGKNGSGKSSLVKALMGKTDAFSLSGKVQRRENLNTVYMDQGYQIIDHNLTLIGNVEKHNPGISNEDARRQLGRFLFFQQEDIRKKAEVLSGGEAARLTLAMVTAKPVDLLVLDEPTNNLDIETLDVIADALEDFPGALVVISHNTHFLERVGIETALMISHQKLTQMKTSPLEPEEFYEEMVNAIKREA